MLAELAAVNVCEGCGALVVSTEQHDKFHENLGRTAQQAHRAAVWNNPLA
jgi:hypothetical protein